MSPLVVGLLMGKDGLGRKAAAGLMALAALGLAKACMELARDKEADLGVTLFAGSLLIMGAILFFGCASKLHF